MRAYAITDAAQVPGGDVVARAIELLDAGVAWLQLRERDAAGRAPAARELHALARRIVARAGGERLLVNDRLDVALAAGCAGVHLTARSFSPAEVKRRYPRTFVGVSAHDLEEVRRAAGEGADLVVLGPVFATRSKPSAAPLGVEALVEARAAVPIPVFALGGVDAATIPRLLAAGVGDVAGISLFMREGAGALRRLRRAALPS